MIDARGSVLLAADVIVLIVVVLNPLRRQFDDSDKGCGNVVVLPKPHQATLWRDGLFVMVAIVRCSS